jgi:hypothetical protein
MRIGTIRRFPVYLQDILKAWARLRPHWQPDISAWTIADALSFPVPQTFSAANPHGVLLRQLLSLDSSTSRLTLMTPDAARQKFQRQAPARIVEAVTQLHQPSNTLTYQLVQLILSSPPPYPTSTPFVSLLTLLLAADVALTDLTTAIARRYIDTLDRVPQALDWNTRALGRLAVPPQNIWTRLWHGPLLPRHRETWYKLLMNALPLGTRIWSFAPEHLLCHACSVSQSLHHFVYACTLAQQVWQDFAVIFQLPQPVTLSQALFSWSTGGSRYLGRAYGYQLQAGHAVALHTLWTAHTQAVYADHPSSCQAISHRFRSLLRRHFRMLAASPRYSSLLEPIPPFLL